VDVPGKAVLHLGHHGVRDAPQQRGGRGEAVLNLLDHGGRPPLPIRLCGPQQLDLLPARHRTPPPSCPPLRPSPSLPIPVPTARPRPSSDRSERRKSSTFRIRGPNSSGSPLPSWPGHVGEEEDGEPLARPHGCHRRRPAQP